MQKFSPDQIIHLPDCIREVMPNELVMIDLLDRGLFPKKITDSLKIISGKTRRVSLLVEQDRLHELVDGQSFLGIWSYFGLTQINLIINLDVPSYTFNGIGGQSPYLRKVVDEVKKIGLKSPTLKIVPCLACPIEQIHFLGPLVALFSEEQYGEINLMPPSRRTEKAVKSYQDLFEYLRMRGITKTWVPFFYFHPQVDIWNMQCFNTFAGPKDVHFDISNKCTHSCVFCGMYGPEAIRQAKKGPLALQLEIKKVTSTILNFEKGKAALQDLPESVKSIQFGGMGDPMTHPNFLDFLRIARERGIFCEVLSNMDYFTEKSIIEISRLGGQEWHGVHFVANISAASEEMYLKTRPRQTAKNYLNVMKTLLRLKEEREKNQGHGAYVTMMCVMTNVNYTEAEEYIKKSKEIGASAAYLKPMEIHIDYQASLLISDSLQNDYAKKIQAAVSTAKNLGIPLHDEVSLIKTIERQTIEMSL